LAWRKSVRRSGDDRPLRRKTNGSPHHATGNGDFKSEKLAWSRCRDAQKTRRGWMWKVSSHGGSGTIRFAIGAGIDSAMHRRNGVAQESRTRFANLSLNSPKKQVGASPGYSANFVSSGSRTFFGRQLSIFLRKPTTNPTQNADPAAGTSSSRGTLKPCGNATFSRNECFRDWECPSCLRWSLLMWPREKSGSRRPLVIRRKPVWKSKRGYLSSTSKPKT
jgi:hypothetical protein